MVGNLDENGLLDLKGVERPDGTRTPDLTIEDLADEAELHRDDAPLVLEMIQNFDPLGVAARDLRECLLIQAEQTPMAVTQITRPVTITVTRKRSRSRARMNYACLNDKFLKDQNAFFRKNNY